VKTALLVIVLLAVAVVVAATSFAEEDAPKPVPKKELVVGVFDSRAIAVAYMPSSFNAKYLEGLEARLEGAKAKNDANKMEEIRAEAARRQHEFHLMAFGTDSVKELLEPVKGRLAAVAKAAGVDVIVSKWEIAFRKPDTKVVDVTRALVGLFDPGEKTLGLVRDLKDKAPIPRDTLLRTRGR